MGSETANGTWNNAYAVQFPFTIGDRTFLYGQNQATAYWFIQELLPYGKMGSETDNGHWSKAYHIQFPFSIGGEVFYYGLNVKTSSWFIQPFIQRL